MISRSDPVLSMYEIWLSFQITVLLYTECCIVLLKSKVGCHLVTVLVVLEELIGADTVDTTGRVRRAC